VSCPCNACEQIENEFRSRSILCAFCSQGFQKLRLVSSLDPNMGNLIASCFARSSSNAVDGSSSAAGAASTSLENFFLQHSDAINCIVAAGDGSFLSCSDDKKVSRINATNGSMMKLWDVGYAVQRCWWGSEELSLAADRGGCVTWLVDHNGTCQIRGSCSHKLTVNALAADMQQVCTAVLPRCCLHAPTLRPLLDFQDMVFSGSRDAVVKTWSLSTQQVSFCLD
jgi:hypothetical protein